jgi:hypothetical protein
MFSGFQELLIIALLLAVIFLIPRVFGKPRAAAPSRPSSPRMPRVPGINLRFGIACSIIWPLVTAFYFEPWQGDLQRFLFVGITPVLIGWACYWVLWGSRRRR